MIVDLSIIGFHNLYEIYIHTAYVLYVHTIQSNDYGGYYGNKLYNKPSTMMVRLLRSESDCKHPTAIFPKFQKDRQAELRAKTSLTSAS